MESRKESSFVISLAKKQPIATLDEIEERHATTTTTTTILNVYVITSTIFILSHFDPKPYFIFTLISCFFPSNNVLTSKATEPSTNLMTNFLVTF